MNQTMNKNLLQYLHTNKLEQCNLQRTTTTGWVDDHDLPEVRDLQNCDLQHSQTCNLTNAERCTVIRQRSPRCDCIAGHIRAKDGSTCVGMCL